MRNTSTLGHLTPVGLADYWLLLAQTV